MKRGIVWPVVVEHDGALSAARQSLNRSNVGQLWVRLMTSLRLLIQTVLSMLAALSRHLCQLASKLNQSFSQDLHGCARPSTLESSVPWIHQLEALDYTQVMDLAALLNSKDLFPDDHLFKMLAKQDMLKDVRVFLEASPQQPSDVMLDVNNTPSVSSAPDSPHPALSCRIVSINQFGHGVCGHPGIMHGGMTAALIDETCGALLYMVRERGFLDFKFVVTASLQIQYKQPMSPSKPVVVTAWITEMSGRKIWVDVVASDLPWDPTDETHLFQDGTTSSNIYATAKALFIIPRPEGNSTSVLQQHGGQQVLGGRKNL